MRYKTSVASALSEIKSGLYKKIIVSRAVDLKERVDMPATLLRGRRANTPARTFCLNQAGFQATGFSPELVVSVDKGKVTTEPLAGTRSRIGTKEEIEVLANELLNDDKEILEHVLSVKEPINELNRV